MIKDSSPEYLIIAAREEVLVDAQCLLQQALNETYGNPRDFEETDPKKTRKLFKQQRVELAKLMGKSLRSVGQLFSDYSRLQIKDLAEALHVLGYSLKIDIEKQVE